LAAHFINIYSKENKKEIEGISDEVMEILENYDWPGNIRELENLIERAIVLSKYKIINRDSLPPFLIPRLGKEGKSPSNSNNELTLKEQVLSYQKNSIIDALKKTRGVQKEAAQILGVKSTTLNEMIKRFRIDVKNIV